MTPQLLHALAAALVPLAAPLVVALIALVRAETARIAAAKAQKSADQHAQLPPDAAHPQLLRRAVPFSENHDGP